MGIGGHMLGKKKLAKLNKWSPITFYKAYNRSGEGEGIHVYSAGQHTHHRIDFKNKLVYGRIEKPMHWASCGEI